MLERLSKNTARILSAIALVILFASPAIAQREQVRYVSQFPGATVGAMYTAAQNSCTPDTAIPCIVIADSTLAANAAGAIPTPCVQCTFIDYRTAGAIKIASNASPILTALSTGAAAGGLKTEFSIVAQATGASSAGATLLLNAQSVAAAEWVAGAKFVFESQSKWVNSDSSLAKVAGFGVAIDGTVRGSCNASSVTPGATSNGYERLSVFILTTGAGGTALVISECSASVGVSSFSSTVTTIAIDTTAAHSIAASVAMAATDSPSTGTNYYFFGTRTN